MIPVSKDLVATFIALIVAIVITGAVWYFCYQKQDTIQADGSSTTPKTKIGLIFIVSFLVVFLLILLSKYLTTLNTTPSPNSKPNFNDDYDTQLVKVFVKWTDEKVYREGHPPTYVTLVHVLKEMSLSGLSSEFEKAIKDRKDIKMADNIDLLLVNLIAYEDKDVRVWRVLLEHYESFVNIILGDVRYFCSCSP